MEDVPDEERVELPKDALIIAGRLGEQFQFIRCNDSCDSPVWYFNERELGIKQSHPNVIAWLYSFADEAQQAIANGYYSWLKWLN